MNNLKQYVGDSASHTVPLIWNNQSFEPDVSWLLLLTVKANRTDADRFALFQKALGAGITVSGSSATFQVVPQDTENSPARIYYGDIQAQSTTTGEIRTVCEIELTLVPDVSRGNQSTIEIHTMQPGYPNGPAGPPNVLSIGTVTTGAANTPATATISGTSPAQVLNLTIPKGRDGVNGSDAEVTGANMATGINAASEKTTPANADKITITDSADSGSLKWLSWQTIKNIFFADATSKANAAQSAAIAAAATDATNKAATKSNLVGGNIFSGTQQNSGIVTSSAALGTNPTQFPNQAQVPSVMRAHGKNTLPVTTSLNPAAITAADFKRIGKVRPMSPLDEESIIFEDNFTAIGDGGKLIGLGESVTEIGGGEYTYTKNLGTDTFRAGNAVSKIPWVTASIKITELGTAGNARVGVGFVFGDNPSTDATTGERLFAIYTRSTSTIEIYTKGGSLAEGTKATISYTWDGAFELAVWVSGETLSVWTRKENQSWVYHATYAHQSVVDPRLTTKRANMRPSFFCYKESGAEAIKVTNFRMGYPLGVGLANPSILTYEDGEPYVKDGKHYFIANATNPYPILDEYIRVRASWLCVWSIDLRSQKLKLESRLSFRRTVRGNEYVFGENSGCFVYDRDNKEFVLVVPDWGSAVALDIKNHIYRVKENILTGTHVLAGTKITMPGRIHQWDPALRKKADGKWIMLYNETDAGNVWTLRTAESTDLINWTLLNSTTYQNEGNKWHRFDGNWYAISGKSGTSNFVTYSETLTLLADVVTPTDGSRHGMAAHPMYIPVAEGNQSQLYLITMDNFQFQGMFFSWGNLDIYKIGQPTNGWEWPQPVAITI